MTTLVLAALALLLAGPVPWALGRMPRLRRTPATAMALWQAVALAAVLAALGAGLSLVTTHGLGRQTPGSYAVAVLALVVTALVLGRLLFSGHVVGTRLRTLRRRHRRLVDLLSAEDRPGGARVLPTDAPMAWCVPGVRRSRVVLTRAAVSSLDDAALDAVLAHERAHLRARHDLVLEAFTVLHHAFPAVLSSRRALDEVRLLVELLADGAARRRVGARPLVAALGALVAGAPESALGALGAAGGGSTAPGGAGEDGGMLRARLEVLLDERPHRLQAALLLTAAAAVLLAPTLLVVLPWLDSLG